MKTTLEFETEKQIQFLQRMTELVILLEQSIEQTIYEAAIIGFVRSLEATDEKMKNDEKPKVIH